MSNDKNGSDNHKNGIVSDNNGDDGKQVDLGGGKCCQLMNLFLPTGKV